jgi:hypothetical protein
MTLVGLFDDVASARAAADELKRSGMTRGDVRISADAGVDAKGMLSRVEVPQQDAEVFREGIRRGGTLLTAVVEDAKAEEAQRLLERRGAIDIDERASEWRGSGWTGAGALSSGEGEVRLPVVGHRRPAERRPAGDRG